MKKRIGLAAMLLAILGVAVATVGCNLGGEGTVELSLTDSPVLDPDVVKAVITISSIEYSLSADTGGSGETWETLTTFDPPQEFDLLTLQGGEVELLASASLPAGTIGQIRFILQAPEATTGDGAPTTSGCYLELADTTRVPLFATSASTSGFKATGAFDVPRNGTVEITADFDVRKSLVRRGVLDSYVLKPTIRLVVNNEAGGLNVTLTGAEAYETIVVFAYEDGDYSDAEAELPLSETDDPQFADAVTSAVEGEAGTYPLRFLAAGTYDLVVAAYNAEGEFVEVAGVHQDAVVVSETNTAVAVDLGALPVGNIVFSLTDSPVLAEDVAKVVIAITEIQYSLSTDDGGAEATWHTLAVFDPAQPYDLLTLQGGVSTELAQGWLPAGHIGQVRFMLDAPETGSGVPSTPGCYVELTDATQVPLFVPSGSSSGFKAVGGFDVPVNGTVGVTADFDVRKSVVQRGSKGSYLLKPTIRVVVDDEVGAIAATVLNLPADRVLAAFAYEDGTYAAPEADLPATEDDAAQFSGAVASSALCGDGKYRIAYLAEGTYDLVVAAYLTDGTFESVLSITEDVVVDAIGSTPVTIDLSL